ncbi:unnamed protein product [Didymodactylos carnosus]|uniref:Uncharacterized protein n=1 Tax=Didymodactylos carnosus TaxID=1234261 RepID=A0A8S2FEM7_9BILA|nr:unnamed protein product [Didymodactylos carnosus]CAF4230667.1 unnamed protein product [Didymodactylos carnosus]
MLYETLKGSLHETLKRCCHNTYILDKRRPRKKISDNIEGIVMYLLTEKYSYSLIQQELSEMNLNVSKRIISRIANKVGKQRQLYLLNNQKPTFYHRHHRSIAAIVTSHYADRLFSIIGGHKGCTGIFLRHFAYITSRITRKVVPTLI